MARPLPSLAIAEMPISAISEDPRVHALQRLYRRRELVDELISSLELYQETKTVKRAPCIAIDVGRGWAS
jgi:hypothetical protein